MSPPPSRPLPPAKPTAAPPPPPVARPPATAKAAAARVPAKTFAIAPFSPENQGTKIVMYAKTGGGKTTLASMAPDPVFIAFDDGARKILNPKTGQPVSAIPGITGFQDVRDALHQRNLFPDGCTLVFDTVTKMESASEQYIFDNYPLKSGKATSMRAFGWDGPAHQIDVMRLFLSDLDSHVAAGRNVILLAQQAQIKIPHAAGLDYLEDGPKLQHNNQYSSRMEVCEWADHVLRIGYQDFDVQADNEKARVGKVQGNGEMTRAIFSGGAAHFIAKSRPIDGRHLPPVISFASKQDDSLWQMIFNGAIPD